MSNFHPLENIHLKLKIASANPASNEWKIETNNLVAHRLIDKYFIPIPYEKLDKLLCAQGNLQTDNDNT